MLMQACPLQLLSAYMRAASQASLRCYDILRDRASRRSWTFAFVAVLFLPWIAAPLGQCHRSPSRLLPVASSGLLPSSDVTGYACSANDEPIHSCCQHLSTAPDLCLAAGVCQLWCRRSQLAFKFGASLLTELLSNKSVPSPVCPAHGSVGHLTSTGRTEIAPLLQKSG